MSSWFPPAYPWIKAAHLIFAIFWIAGMFMLPRFIVYQMETAPGSPEDHAWSQRTRKLRKIILTPSMLLVWALGLTLAAQVGAFRMGWFHVKFALVVLLGAYHGWAVGLSRKVARGYRPESDRWLRLMNELPALAMIVIVIMVIVKPF